MRYWGVVAVLSIIVGIAGCSPRAQTGPASGVTTTISTAPAAATESAKPQAPSFNGTYSGGPFWGAIVGSFRTSSPDALDAVQKTQARLASKGFPTYWAVSDWYSSLRPGYLIVYTAPFANSTDADEIAKRLRKAGFKGAYPRQFAPGRELAAASDPAVAKGLLMSDDGEPYGFLSGQRIDLNQSSDGTVFGWLGDTYINLYTGVGGSTYGWVGDEYVSLFEGTAGSTYGWVGDSSVNLYEGVGGSTYGWVGDDSVNLFNGPGGSTYGWSGDDYVQLYEGVGGSTYGWIGDEYIYATDY